MRSAQSRLGVVTSLGAARRGVGRCANALPLPGAALRVGAAALAGLAGVALLRSLASSRRAAAAAATAAPDSRRMGRYLLSEAVLTLLLPLCRRYFLGAAADSGSNSPGGNLDRLLKGER